MLRPRRFLLIVLVAAVLAVTLWQNAQTQSTLRRITNTTDEGISFSPSLSGDGRILAFESTEDVAHAGGSEGFRAIRANVANDPATLVQMGATRAPAPGVSQDGSRITFASKDNPLGTNNDANSEIFLYNGSALLQITNTSPATFQTALPTETLRRRFPTMDVSLLLLPIAIWQTKTQTAIWRSSFTIRSPPALVN